MNMRPYESLPDLTTSMEPYPGSVRDFAAEDRRFATATRYGWSIAALEQKDPFAALCAKIIAIGERHIASTNAILAESHETDTEADTTAAAAQV